MCDLVKRLRGEETDCKCCAWSAAECACDTAWPEHSCEEAADEIERLRKDNEAMQEELRLIDLN